MLVSSCFIFLLFICCISFLRMVLISLESCSAKFNQLLQFQSHQFRLSHPITKKDCLYVIIACARLYRTDCAKRLYSLTFFIRLFHEYRLFIFSTIMHVKNVRNNGCADWTSIYFQEKAWIVLFSIKYENYIYKYIFIYIYLYIYISIYQYI